MQLLCLPSWRPERRAPQRQPVFCSGGPRALLPPSLQPTGKMLADGQLAQPLVYMERLELIRNVCRDAALKNLSHTAVSKFVLDRIFVCDKHKILFCQTPKVGNTQWKKVLIVLNGACRACGVSSLGDFGVCPGKATVTWGWGEADKGAGRSHRKGYLLRGADNLSDSSPLCFSCECCTLKVSGVNVDTGCSQRATPKATISSLSTAEPPSQAACSPGGSRSFSSDSQHRFLLDTGSVLVIQGPTLTECQEAPPTFALSVLRRAPTPGPGRGSSTHRQRIQCHVGRKKCPHFTPSIIFRGFN